jgi:3-hydroxyisobutyrate dehydrogenase
LYATSVRPIRTPGEHEEDTLQRIGFIGLGNMGLPMCKNLVRAGYEVSAFDLRAEAVEEVVKAGGRAADSEADAARGSDALVTMLPGPRQVEAVMVDRDGAAYVMEARSVWIDMSTSNFETAERVRAAAGPEGPAMLDAPVCGGTHGATMGTLKVFVGGGREAYERSLGVLRVVGNPEHVFHVGGGGAGYAAKLCVNLLWYMHSAATAEVLSLTAKAGVSLDTLHGALTSCAANSQFLVRDFPSVFVGDYDLSFSLALVCKDLGLAVDLGRRTGAPLEVAALVKQLHRKAHAHYGDFGGQLSAVRLVEDATGTPLRTPAGNAGPEGELTYAT